MAVLLLGPVLHYCTQTADNRSAKGCGCGMVMIKCERCFKSLQIDVALSPLKVVVCISYQQQVWLVNYYRSLQVYNRWTATLSQIMLVVYIKATDGGLQSGVQFIKVKFQLVCSYSKTPDPTVDICSERFTVYGCGLDFTETRLHLEIFIQKGLQRFDVSSFYLSICLVVLERLAILHQNISNS